jgi:hypothetical protein
MIATDKGTPQEITMRSIATFDEKLIVVLRIDNGTIQVPYLSKDAMQMRELILLASMHHTAVHVINNGEVSMYAIMVPPHAQQDLRAEVTKQFERWYNGDPVAFADAYHGLFAKG